MPGVMSMIQSTHAKYGGEIDLVKGGKLYGAYDTIGLAAVLGWIDAPGYRFITEWASAPGRRGLRGSAILIRKARRRKLVGLIALANEDARAWVKANGGREEAVFAILPEA